VVVFGVGSLPKWISFCFKIFFIFEVFINGEMSHIEVMCGVIRGGKGFTSRK
jgi:hypothetical protein